MTSPQATKWPTMPPIKVSPSRRRMKRTSNRAVRPQEDIPEFVKVPPVEGEETSSVSSGVTLPRALMPRDRNQKKAKTTSIHAELFAQALQEEEEERRQETSFDTRPREDALPDLKHEGHLIGALGLAPILMAMDRTKPNSPLPNGHLEVPMQESNCCNSTVSGSGPPEKDQSIFRRIQERVSSGSKRRQPSSPEERLKKKDNKTQSKTTPRNDATSTETPNSPPTTDPSTPSRGNLDLSKSPPSTTPTSKESNTPSRPIRKLLSKTPPPAFRPTSFLPSHLTHTPSDDEDDKFLEELTENAVGEVLSEAFSDIELQDETIYDSPSFNEDTSRHEHGIAHGDGEISPAEQQRTLKSISHEQASTSEKDSLYPHGIQVVGGDGEGSELDAVDSSKQNDRFAVPSIRDVNEDAPSGVVDEEATSDIPSLSEVDPPVASNQSQPKKKRRWILIIAILLVACLTGVVAGFLANLSQSGTSQSDSSLGDDDNGETGSDTNDNDRTPSGNPSWAPTISPTMRPSLSPSLPQSPSETPTSLPPLPTLNPTLQPTTGQPLSYPELILQHSPESQSAIKNAKSPQARALKWLEQHPVQLSNEQALQRFALVTMFHSLSTSDQGWKERDLWLSHEGSECSWYGVSCNDQDQVALINLNFNNLVGTLASEVSLLSNLKLLSLAGTEDNKDGHIIGKVPPSWGDLTNLEALELYGNKLTGPIPDTFGKLTNLKTLRLDDNEMSSSIPKIVGDMKNLQILDLTSNRFSGQIPSELGRLSNLGNLSLQRNRLHQRIPSELGQLTMLSELYLNGNSLTGDLPLEIFTLSNLVWMALYNNEFEGRLPADIWQLVKIEGIQLQGNGLHGKIPPEVRHLKRLRVLDLSKNQLSGHVPSQLQYLENLAGLYVHENDLTGSVPKAVCDVLESGLRRFWSDCNSELVCSCCTRCF